MKKRIGFNVYSSMLGAFIAMGFETEEAARKFIAEYSCREEARTMSVTRGTR